MLYSEYIRSLGTLEGLDRETEAALARRAAKGDDAARDRLVRSCLPRVISIAKRYRAWRTDFDDLLGYGTVGLLKGVDRFDPERGVRLATYASFWIRAEIRASVIGDYRGVRLGTTATERRAIRAYRTRSIESPEELAQISGMPERRARRLWPLLAAGDVPLDDRTRTGALRHEQVADREMPTPEQALLRVERARHLRHGLPRALRAMSEREQVILRMRMLAEDPKSLREIGEEVGLSRERVRQIESACREKLRRALAAAA